MEIFSVERFCKYCSELVKICQNEGLECCKCTEKVHVKCLKRGSVPGGLHGDVFFTFECQECSETNTEVFTRNKISWLQIIVLVLYHLQNKSPGLARKGFFHWRHHMATFIDRNWDIIFPLDIKKKKKWTGTVAGTLSHFSPHIFLSGTFIFNEPAWWTLLYPKLSPLAMASIYFVMNMEKQVMKNKKIKVLSETELFEHTLRLCIKDEELLQTFIVMNAFETPEDVLNREIFLEEPKKYKKPKHLSLGKRKKSHSSLLGVSRKLLKLTTSTLNSDNNLSPNFTLKEDEDINLSFNVPKIEENKVKETTLFDPFCHYNTSLNNISRLKGLSLQAKLTGGIRQELILSPYSEIYLKPYIRRDYETVSDWLTLMAELQLVVNKHNKDYVIPARSTLDYTYVQPEHIPAINSICNHFFWPGIDLTESLQYPDFSCVCLYKRLIVGFAFLIPNVSHTENYLSFLFTRPGWRNCGIAKFMVYHLIQTSLGKDITLHVSINNPALFLYQKFGFKVENVVLDFYDKYIRSDTRESKHAFFCRLER